MPPSFRGSSTLVLLLLVFASPAFAGSPRLLTLHRHRRSPYDLAMTGLLSGVPAGAVRYLRPEQLRALPTHKLDLTGEFVPGRQKLTVVFLADLWRRLSRAPGADVLLATCKDGYAAVFTRDFIVRDRPFLVLAIDGRRPDRWPPPGLAYNPGPYVISVSAKVAPPVARLLDAEHKKPWGVTTLEVANFAARFHAIYSGRWAHPSPAAAQGREIWVNSCASCHAGPDGSFGGTKSGQPFAVLAALARCDPPFFKLYVHDPKAANPEARMEPHPRYTDAQLDELVAFVAAGSRP